jgi:multiple sugar transport system substrate-binding protein
MDMLKSNRLRLTILAALAASLTMATAVQAAVTVLGWPGGAEETALRATVKVYNALPTTADNDKVNLIFFNRDGFFDKLQTDMAAGTDAFDANLLATYSIGRYAPYMDPITLSPDAEKVFGAAVLKTMQYDGKQFGVPTDLSLQFMFYRKDLVDALLKNKGDWKTYSAIAQKYLGKALTPKDPADWTWDDWAATALYFTKAVNPASPVRYGTVLQMKNLLFNMMVFEGLPRSYGGNWTDDKGNVTVDSDAWKTALKLYKTLYDAGVTPKDSLSYEYPETDAAFESGQVATALQWVAAAGELTDKTKAPAVADEVGIAPPPAGPDGRFDHIHSLGLGLNKSAKNKAGAVKFLQWLSTEDAALTYAKAGGSPALAPDVVAKISAQRPDLVTLGKYAVDYGLVMNGATSANALSIYELQAKEFTGYWSGQESLDTALGNVKAGMAKLLK